MSMTNKPNDVRVSRDLLEAIYTAGWERSSDGYNAEWSCDATNNDDWKSDMSQAIDAALLAQPAGSEQV
ncbi:hypothetical protein [Pseudomonas viridiflava]|uniref:hypothetical protein n=1 Tax=Pseudomonas viridiflava TaxID=33069 RepID=UPI002EAB8429|nr:hypothetical protein [Pseudomonas viridiflava]